VSSRISLWLGVLRAGRTTWMDDAKHGAWYEIGAWLRRALDAKGFDATANLLGKIKVLDGTSLNDPAALADARDAFLHFITGEWSSLRVPPHATWRHSVTEPDRAVLLDVDTRAIHLMRRGVSTLADVTLLRTPDEITVPPGLKLVATLMADAAAADLATFAEWCSYDLHGYEKGAWEGAYVALANDPVRTASVPELIDLEPPRWTSPPTFKALVQQVRRELAISTAGHFVRGQDPQRLVRWIDWHPEVRVAVASQADLVPAVIEALLLADDEDTRVTLARRSDTHAGLLLRLFKSGGDRTKDAVLEHQRTPPEVFAALAASHDTDPAGSARRHRAAHAVQHPEVQLAFARHPEEQTRLWLAKNASLSEAAHAVLKKDPSLVVRAAAAR
jgi:hypothetical protein